MSIFSSIKDAIFGHPAVQEAAPAASPAPETQSPPTAAEPTPAATEQPATIDADAALEKIAESKNNPDLNWQTSIVDLMKLLDLDSSLSNREELATELGYTGEKDGSAAMNEWLHEKVMERIRTGK